MRFLYSVIGVAGLAGVVWGAFDPPQSPSPSPSSSPPVASPPADPNARFDKLVREDLFAGFGGDEVALQRGLEKCEATLKADPKHAEALVWRGSVRVFQSSRYFAKNQFISGMNLWSQGIQDMDDAVALAPNSPGVRIPRAAVLLPAARSTPAAMSRPLLKRVLDDFQTIATLQAHQTETLGTHPLGELRMGLADVYRLSGDLDRSREQLELVRKQLPGSEYAGRAQEWLAAGPDAKLVHNCIGCHGQ